MDIGVVMQSGTGSGDAILDIKDAIRRARCNPVDIRLDDMIVRMGKGGVRTHMMLGDKKDRRIDVGCAVLRNLGVIRDYEQFSHRIWSIRAMELSGIYVSNSIIGLLRAGDKLGALSVLSSRGLPVPETASSENFFAGYNAVKEFGQAVVKPLRGGQGYGIFKVDDPDVAMHIFSSFANLNKPIYVQKYLDKMGAGDYRVIVVGGEVIGTEFRKGKGWKSNVAMGGSARVVKADSELRELAIKAAEVLELDYVGMDIAKTREGYVIIEANPRMGWTSFRKVTKVNPAKKIISNLIEKVRK